MALLQSDYAKGLKPIPVSQNADSLCLFFEVQVPAAGAGAALNDIIEMGALPAGHVPVDFILSADDLDTGGPTITLSVGIIKSDKSDLSTAAADGGAVWLANSTVAQAGGLVRPTTKVIHDVAVDQNVDRPLGLKVTAAATTPAAGKVRLVVVARATP